MNALIPGINNIPSVGSKPTCKVGKTIVNNSLMSIPKLKSPITNEEIPFYNPITNPVPRFTDNPYIMKEKQLIACQSAKYLGNKTTIAIQQPLL